MTPKAVRKARDGLADASTAAKAFWAALATAADRPGIDVERLKAALDLVSQHVGEDTDVPDAVLREALVRSASYLENSGHLLGYHGGLGEGLPEADPRVGGYSALRRSGAMGLLAPWVTRRAGAI